MISKILKRSLIGIFFWGVTVFGADTTEDFTGKSIEKIGMPIGGICTGQLYLGGDGKLWHWNIFKLNYSRDHSHEMRLDHMSFGRHYSNPLNPYDQSQQLVEQGFAIKIKDEDGKESIKQLNKFGFKDITFRGEYPLAKIFYKNQNYPVEINLTAFSPFIPLDEDNSGIPAVIFSFKVKNTSPKNVKVSLLGWLENSVCPWVRKNNSNNKAVRTIGIKVNDKICSLNNEISPFLKNKNGYGSMALSIINPENMKLTYGFKNANEIIKKSFYNHLKYVGKSKELKSFAINNRPVGVLGSELKLQPGETQKVEFVLSWYFPYFNEITPGELNAIKEIKNNKRFYAKKFKNAYDVALSIKKNYKYLVGKTLLWNKTWYDSTLPKWILNRTFSTMSNLATSVCIRFDNDRFWAWEGVDACPGTCQHVWNYAQGMARIFPKLERDLRSNVDLGPTFKNNGQMAHRGENGRSTFIDAQAGTVVRMYREHTMSKDYKFLNNNWLKIKKSIEWLILQDGNNNGLLEGPQANTLDATWYGPMGWLSSIYLSALAAGKEMALEMNDEKFAKKCDKILKVGRQNLVEKLYNGEYFIHMPPNYRSINSNDGCLTEQVLGQSFAFQAGLTERIVPKKETISALNSLYKYNFLQNCGKYEKEHKEIKGARVYAKNNEAGLMTCTWPKSDGDKNAVPEMKNEIEDGIHWGGPGSYFDEVWTGFEYQVASHMIYEGKPNSKLVKQGLELTRAIHKRYSPSKRNPYNEIECSDHYARSLASYGVYLALCGYRYHGPKGILEFAPKLNPEKFKCAFTVANGWGTFSQKQTSQEQISSLKLVDGILNLKQFNLQIPDNKKIDKVTVFYLNKIVEMNYNLEKDKILIKFNESLKITTNNQLKVVITWK